MPYLKFPSFKTGISPSAKSRFDPENLTGTQKLTLVSSRIFGFRIGGNVRSGQKALRRGLMGMKRESKYDVPVWNVKEIFPYLQNKQEHERKNVLIERRKLRMMMRGIKVGRLKGGGRVNLMSIFEIK